MENRKASIIRKKEENWGKESHSLKKTRQKKKKPRRAD